MYLFYKINIGQLTRVRKMTAHGLSILQIPKFNLKPLIITLFAAASVETCDTRF